MRIISKFKDYYDGVQAYGADQTVVYVRHEQIIDPSDVSHNYSSYLKRGPNMYYGKESPKAPRLISRHCPWWGGQMNAATYGVLLFCGKRYAFAVAQDENGNQITSFDNNFSDAVPMKNTYVNWWDRTAGHNIEFSDWIAQNSGVEIDPEVHFHYSSPTIIMVGNKTIVNPTLKDFSVQKLIDPYTAYQELDMFMSGVMSSNRDPASPMTDQEKITSHGMDPKWSFRKKVR